MELQVDTGPDEPPTSLSFDATGSLLAVTTRRGTLVRVCDFDEDLARALVSRRDNGGATRSAQRSGFSIPNSNCADNVRWNAHQDGVVALLSSKSPLVEM